MRLKSQSFTIPSDQTVGGAMTASELIGRAGERARLRALLQAAREGHSAALVVRGEAGVGKTALLQSLVGEATDFRLVGVHGIESEAEFAFSGLADLLRPLLGHLSEVPPVQAAGLKAALALGPPVAGDRFTVSVATLSLLAAAAEQQPVLAVVDDAHWLDAPSAEVLLFVARRLKAEGVVLLLAMRDGEPTSIDTAGLAELVVPGLSPPAATTLLTRHADAPIASVIAAGLVQAAGGNPLALLEMPFLLSPAQLAGAEPLDEPIRAGASIERAFLRRAADLPESARVALLVAAASDSGDMVAIAGALDQLGVDIVALEKAEAAGLVSLTDHRIEFRHPLLRAAVYHGAPPALRRSAHRALAAALAGGDEDRRAWHLAAAATGPDQEAADALAQAAARSQERGGYATAARALALAARLSQDSGQRARRLMAAGQAHWFAGQLDQALGPLDAALSLANGPRERADIQHLRAHIETWRGNMHAAKDLLVAEAERVAPADLSKAALMMADSVSLSITAGDIPGAVVSGRRACALADEAEAGEEVRAYASLTLGLALVNDGQAREGYPLLVRTRSCVEQAPSLGSSRYLGPLLATHLGTWVEDWPQVLQWLDRGVDSARARSAPGMLLPLTLAVRSELHFRAGRWEEAFADATESGRLARETSQWSALPFSLLCAARVEAARGRASVCHAMVAEALELINQQRGLRSLHVHAASALGLLELGLGRPDAAIEHLSSLPELLPALGQHEPAAVQWAPDYIEACARTGRTEQAMRALGTFEREAETTGRTWALAAAARCRGLLQPAAQCTDAFADAAYWHSKIDMPFERARTELCHGEQLRRAKRRAEARQHLRAALAVFEQLSAQPWAERARTELQATGETTRRRGVAPTGQLTAQEFRVATLVADGKRNQDIAAALFLSPKTVEFHLTSIHRKLGTTSRVQLVRLLLKQPPPQPSTHNA
jgi:DNA-binding CsgD family transcriptional regulator